MDLAGPRLVGFPRMRQALRRPAVKPTWTYKRFRDKQKKGEAPHTSPCQVPPKGFEPLSQA